MRGFIAETIHGQRRGRVLPPTKVAIMTHCFYAWVFSLMCTACYAGEWQCVCEGDGFDDASIGLCFRIRRRVPLWPGWQHVRVIVE